jgi:hypothetical protein
MNRTFELDGLVQVKRGTPHYKLVYTATTRSSTPTAPAPNANPSTTDSKYGVPGAGGPRRGRRNRSLRAKDPRVALRHDGVARARTRGRTRPRPPRGTTATRTGATGIAKAVGARCREAAASPRSVSNTFPRKWMTLPSRRKRRSRTFISNGPNRNKSVFMIVLSE